ncbi:MAG TPA: DUF1569 domain-containing protein [Gemmataceae bacterium]|jgi:hypothetical protein|nr:DUF1569 domain-containing protein [Gemmataceae bacterium]
MPVNTAKVQGRRKLDYASFDDLLADADGLSSGQVQPLGNWSAGQIFRHLATVYVGSIDGFAMTFPLHIRLVARLFKKKLLAGSMPAGLKLPAQGSEELMPPPTSTEEGLAELHAAVGRLQRETTRAKHPVFGNLTNEEWTRLHLKHASLHMSFLVPA